MATLARRVWDSLRLARYRREAAAHGGWVEVRRLGLRWRLAPGNFLDRQILLRGRFEPETTRRVLEVVKPGMRVVDVGANMGYFATLLARQVGSAGKVWAFEPSPTFRGRLVEHLRTNALEGRVAVLDYGLSGAEEDLALHSEESSATLHPVAPKGETVTVHLRRLDDVCDGLGMDRADLVKVDIDGHEPFFLAGAQSFLRTRRPVIVMEFSQEHLDVAGSDVRQLKQALEDLGYELHSEKTGRPFASRREFLLECGNFKRSANVWAHPE